MLADRVLNPGPLTYESGALPIALRGLARSCQKVCEALTFLLDNIYIRFGSKLYRQIVGLVFLWILTVPFL